MPECARAMFNSCRGEESMREFNEQRWEQVETLKNSEHKEFKSKLGKNSFGCFAGLAIIVVIAFLISLIARG